MITHQERYSFETRLASVGLGFLAPGLGHIFQGVIGKDANRLTKGVFFLVALWGMFFYGMWLAKWKNVYLPPVAQKRPAAAGGQLPPLIMNLYTRLHYVGQFWIGSVAWPALWNYYLPDRPIFGEFERVGKDLDAFEAELNELQLDPAMGRLWDIAWVYTVIAGVLNILVIYDAWAGPVRPRRESVPATLTEGKAA